MLKPQSWADANLDDIPFHSDKNPHEGALKQWLNKDKKERLRIHNEKEAREMALCIKGTLLVCFIGISFGYGMQLYHAFF